MKILHTSDWHIGKLLHKQKRHEEFEKFFLWLSDLIDAEHIDTLLVAGDIFDNTTPGNRALEMYYNFLNRAAASGCRHIVVIGGNHDSPSLLNAPREILRSMNIHITGCVTGSIDDEVVVLCNANGEPELIVCAVPYLRDSDVRTSDEGETQDHKINKTLDGIRRHYAQVIGRAEDKRIQLNASVPMIAMGHLFAAGGSTIEGDGVRELYVGGLAHVDADIFPPSLDYVALGHLHVPQKMGGLETRRYSGSPIPMGFGEADQEKGVIVVETGAGPCSVRTVPIPCFQKLKQLRGDWKSIAHQLKTLSKLDIPYWLEVIYDGVDCIGNLQEHIDAAVEHTQLTVLTTIDLRRTQAMMGTVDASIPLDELTEEDIFLRCLDSRKIPDDVRPELIETFREAVLSYQHRDTQNE
jgi:DNA repair protein SbcD/Mre11